MLLMRRQHSLLAFDIPIARQLNLRYVLCGPKIQTDPCFRHLIRTNGKHDLNLLL